MKTQCPHCGKEFEAEHPEEIVYSDLYEGDLGWGYLFGFIMIFLVILVFIYSAYTGNP